MAHVNRGFECLVNPDLGGPMVIRKPIFIYEKHVLDLFKPCVQDKKSWKKSSTKVKVKAVLGVIGIAVVLMILL